MSRNGHAARRGAFTLVELLVCISIIVLLISLLMPALASSRASAWQVMCLNQLRGNGMAMVYYATDFRGVITKTDYGRNDTNGSWQDFTMSIGNSRAAPDEKKTTQHGAWLLNGYLPNAGPFFCPGMRILMEGGSGAVGPLVSRRKETYMTTWAPTLSSGGLVVPPASPTWGPIITTSYTVYALLSPLDQDFPGDPGTMALHMLRNRTNYRLGRRIQEFNATFPIMADYRGGYENGSAYTTNHDSKGWNVLRGDGSAKFINVQTLVAGASAPGIVNTTSIKGNTTGKLPLDPRDDEASWGSNFAGRTASRQNSSQFWNAMHGALK